MKETVKVFVMTIALCYLGASFIAWSFYPGDWHVGLRVAAAGAGVIIPPFVYISVLLEKLDAESDEL